MTRFTVVVCTHNRCDVLGGALTTVAAADRPGGAAVEVVVVDNASTDRTREVVERVAAAAPVPVRYVRELRLGHSFALNTGVAAAAGDVIVFTDDDAFPDRGWLTAYRAAFDAGADWALGPVRPRWATRPPAWYGPEVRGLFATLDYGPDPFVVTDELHPFIGVNHACRAEAVRGLGGYREHLGGFGAVGGLGNDEDLFRRALTAGLRIAYVPGAAVEHLIPDARCTKAYHRRAVWGKTGHQFRVLAAEPPPPPTVLGLPRFYVRKPADHLARWARAVATGNRSGAFYHELQVRRFLMLIGRAIGQRLRGRPPAAVAAGGAS